MPQRESDQAIATCYNHQSNHQQNTSCCCFLCDRIIYRLLIWSSHPASEELSFSTIYLRAQGRDLCSPKSATTVDFYLP